MLFVIIGIQGVLKYYEFNINQSWGDTMIGEKLRKLRKNKKLTIVELAEKIDVTSGYISQIERDLSSPSLAVLKRLADALDTQLSKLFLEDKEEKAILITQNGRTKMKFGNGNIELEFITPLIRKSDKDNHIEAFLFQLKPETWVSDQEISHDSKVYLYILNGKVDLYVEDELFLLQKGDSVFVTENKSHKIYNSNTDESELLCIMSPGILL